MGGDILIRKKIFLQFLGKGAVLPADPFEQHGRVFFFLDPVMAEDFAQGLVRTGIDPLVVPVHCLQFLDERYDCPVHVSGGVRKAVAFFMESFMCHCIFLPEKDFPSYDPEFRKEVFLLNGKDMQQMDPGAGVSLGGGPCRICESRI